METSNRPCVIASVDVLPCDHIILPSENILVNAGQATTESHGPPLTVLDDLELHATTDGLGDSKSATKSLHANSLLRSLPVLETGLERVGRDGDGGLGVVGGGADAVTESVVDARGGGGGGCMRYVGEGGWVGVGGDYAHGLRLKEELA